MCLKEPLCESTKKPNAANWWLEGFTCDGKEATFGAGKLSLSIGKFLPGQQVYKHTILNRNLYLCLKLATSRPHILLATSSH